MDHKAEAVVVTCIDFRLQEIINKWISKYLQPKTYDRVAWAGGVKNLDQILEQVEISQRLHHIKKVVLIRPEKDIDNGAKIGGIFIIEFYVWKLVTLGIILLGESN